MAVKSEVKCGVPRRKSSQSVKFCIKEERNASYKKVSSILQKAESERTEEEKELLFSCSELVKEVTRRIEKRKKVKERLQEVEDPPDLLAEKCHKLAEAVASSTYLVVYTGAGVSTAACIPDYRGTNGIWTLLQQGKDIGLHDLTQAEPTVTHMALWKLYNAGILKHVVSQNCDGLHLRSGLPKRVLSEVHGNMYIEVCCQCKPSREYWRLFDVTEHTARFSHRTMRRCYKCMGPLVDTIVHFGERGKLQWPLNWSIACQAADKADVILCIGSSLKVLKKYPWLWGMDKPAKKRPKLYIVNLQWTPKDDQAILKISGKCDEVMRQVMSHMNLDIPRYIRSQDPMFSHATTLHQLEKHTTTHPLLKQPSAVTQKPCPKCNENEVKPLCDCTKASTLGNKNNRELKIEESEVSANNSDKCLKVETSVGEKEDSLAHDIQMLKDNKVGSFSSVAVDVKKEKDECVLEECFEDLCSLPQKNSLKKEMSEDNKMSVFDNKCFFQHHSRSIASDKESLEIFRSNTSCNEYVSTTAGLKMEIDASFDQISNSDQNNCDRNSLHCKDIILECSALTSYQSCSQSLGINSQSSSSINTVGCDSGASSIKDDRYFLDINDSDCNKPSLRSISPLSLQSLSRILQTEHSYSKRPDNHYVEGRDSKIEGVEGSTHSFVNKRESRQCKRVKTNNTNMQSTRSSLTSQTSSPQSTKESTGKIKTKDEKKQICDDKYDFGDTIMCSFCKSNYSSNSCLFYPQWTSKFENIPVGSRVSVCECCDTDEEDDTDDAEICKSEGGDTHDSCESKASADASKVAKVPNVNPGWYGKGYRKKTKRKRLEKL
ncbi:NAD-dependent protein deacetylase Sirt7 isoform X1 [Periplaneta americana]